MFKKLSAAKQVSEVPGLFVVGTDTGVGKTYVAARIAAALFGQGLKVGVYKPAASGCGRIGKKLVSDDAVQLWEAAGKPGTLEAVCPQRFAAPLAPHLAAKEEGQRMDAKLLRTGIEYWRKRSDVVIVEGAGGLLSPMTDTKSVADLAEAFGYPLVVVVPNRIGAINGCLLTLTAAAARAKPLAVAAIVVNDVLLKDHDDPSTASNFREIKKRCGVPVLSLKHGAEQFDGPVNWLRLAS